MLKIKEYIIIISSLVLGEKELSIREKKIT